MFCEKYIKKRNYKRVRLPFSDFSKGINAYVNEDLLPQKYATMAYNFNSESGALKHCKGLDNLKLFCGQSVNPLNENIVKLYFYKRYDPELQQNDDKLIAYTQGKKLYYIDIEKQNISFTLIEGVTFNKAPQGINYRLNGEDVIIFCSEEDLMTVWDGKNPPYTVESAPKINTMCIHYERLFATVGGEKSCVWFSDDLDPTNWDISLEEAGYIEIIGEKGSLQKVIKFLDYVYIFRSYGISRLTAYSEQTDFSVITLFVGSGKIYPDTVTVCGDRIIFLAEDGIYSFNGLSVTKILGEIYPLLSGCDNSFANSKYYKGCYYLACKLNYNDCNSELVNNTLLEYDISNNKVNLIKGADISSITVISTENYNNIAFSLRGENGQKVASFCEENKLFNLPLIKCWKTPTTDLNYPDKYKIIREIYINTETDIKIAVTTDNLTKMISIKGGKGVQKAFVGLKGKRFSISFYCENERAKISKPQIIADIL